MDFVKKAASSLGNKEDKPADNQQGGQSAGGDGQKEDYLDKGVYFEFLQENRIAL